jgi:hypothetical protein
MAPTIPSRHIHRADDTADTSTGDDNPAALAPHSVKFIQKQFVVFEVSQLTRVPASILLQIEIGWARYHKVDGLVGDEA